MWGQGVSQPDIVSKLYTKWWIWILLHFAKCLSALEQVAQIWQRDRASSINDFRWGWSIWGYYGLKSYFSRHCDMTQFTLMHHMVNKPFLLLGLAAEYRSRRRRRWCANNIAADHQMFITLAGQLSWQRLRRSAVDLYSQELIMDEIPERDMTYHLTCLLIYHGTTTHLYSCFIFF